MVNEPSVFELLRFHTDKNCNGRQLVLLDLNLGPFVQSVVSLMSSLRVISLTVLLDSIYNILIFFAEKNVSSFRTAKDAHNFSAKKVQHICVSLDVNFNESLTHNIVSFEQLGPGLHLFYCRAKLQVYVREGSYL